MADITPFKSNIKTEDVQFRSSVSEAVGNKIGASVNFINTYQYDSKEWTANGPYSITGVPDNGIDIAYLCQSNMEIYGLNMFNNVPGSSGVIEFDIRKHTASNQAGTSIFTTTPKLSYLAGVYACLSIRFSDNTILQNPAGSTMPVLLSSNLNQGDFLTCHFIQKQVGGESAGIEILLRPRT